MNKKRVFLKFSGEALKGESIPVDPSVVHELVVQVCDLLAHGFQLCITVGGGNIFRGRMTSGVEFQDKKITTDSADKMGLMATVINGIAVRDMLATELRSRKMKNRIRLFSDHVAYPLAEMFDDNLDVVESRLNQGEIFIFSGIGTSGLGLSSDTTAIERAVKTKCSLIIKGTGVPGVLADLHDATSIIETITCSTVLEHKDKYGFMDFYAVQKAQEHGIPVRICQCTRGTFSNISMILLQDTSIGTHMKPE